MKAIPLTRGMVALVDDEDYERLKDFKWQLWEYGRNVSYAIRFEKMSDNTRKTRYMHRDILGLTDSRIQADHKDHNGLNNVRSNLRACSGILNRRNRLSYKGSSSRFVGVSWHKRIKRWQAQVYVNGRQICLGYFNSELEAAAKRDEAATKHYGEFANINLP
jgi:hypothetical protein